MKQYEIQCPHCNGTFFTTNENFKEDSPANGSMFSATENIINAGWSHMPLYDSTEYADVVCPSCDGQLLDSAGMVIRKRVCGEIEVEEPKDIMADLMAEYDVDLPETEEVEEVAEEVAEAKEPPSKAECPVCKKKYSPVGLPMHMKHKHPDYEA